MPRGYVEERVTNLTPRKYGQIMESGSMIMKVSGKTSCQAATETTSNERPSSYWGGILDFRRG